MPLNAAQLMSIPGGPGVVGAITAGQGVLITPDGTMSVNPAQICTKAIAGAGIGISPASGVGEVTISSFAQGGGSVPTGGKTIFREPSAPAGWVVDTTSNNRTIRLVPSSGGGLGGTTGFSEVYKTHPITGTINVSSVSLSGASTNTVSLTPSGNVSLGGLSVGTTTIDGNSVGNHNHSYTDWTCGNISVKADPNPVNVCSGTIGSNFQSAMSSGGHNHSASGSGSFSGSPGSHAHPVSGTFSCTTTFSGQDVNLSIKYVDVLLCTKT